MSPHNILKGSDYSERYVGGGFRSADWSSTNPLRADGKHIGFRTLLSSRRPSESKP